MIKIIVSFILLVISVSLFAFWTKPLIKSVNLLKKQRRALIMQKQKIESQINVITAVAPQKTALGFHKMSSYMFTLLSYMDYLKSKGLSVKIQLNGAKNKKAGTGVDVYEENTGFMDIKKITGVIGFADIPNASVFLKVINGIYKAFPVGLTGISLINKDKMDGKINFELYSIGGKQNGQG